MARDFALRLIGGCVPDFAGWSGYPSIAVLSLNPGIDVMCQTLHFALQEKQQPFSALDHDEVGHTPVKR